MPVARLSDRGVVGVAGPEARALLDRLVTCDLDKVSPAAPRFGALLTPQGKIVADFIIFQAGEGPENAFLLDTRAAGGAELVKRLNVYKLRAKVAIADRGSELAVLAGWGGESSPAGAVASAADPRLPELGWRAIVPVAAAPPHDEAAEAAYHARRIRLGVPEGGRDFAFGDAFPHEALMDQLEGVDFDKGCYVGQEVVSRMQHRGTARTRAVLVRYDGEEPPPKGADISAGDRVLGRLGEAAGGRAIALVRVDRAGEALAAGQTIVAAGRPVRIERPGWARYDLSPTAPAA